ncbi:MAG TPA: succinyl-diaminopimelate desuccinylase [Alphaproteobacteria bacterium]|nr:succinyl-diaminopimelate desuccinylase [Alphaproteobacteria bacterium]
MSAAEKSPSDKNPVEILQGLLRCPSVTPAEGGALDLLEGILTKAGFVCHRLKFSDVDTPDVDNLYARWGTTAPHFCFAGHTDVVPVGDVAGWSFDPFGGEVKDGYVCGRGAADMKGPIACFVSAVLRFLEEHKPQGSISFLITGDEEGPSINGTPKMLKWLEEHGEKIDFCLVGEPTSREKLGDMIKIGRRGTFTGYLTVDGKQGHVAYPHLADNPVPKLVKLLAALDALVLDTGNEHFQPSNLETVNIDIGNKAENVIPARARATFNIRFNSHWSGKTLEAKIRETLDATNVPYKLDIRVGGESFYTAPGQHSDLIVETIRKHTGRTPELSTSGGTSDARYIKNHCPVIEFGIVGETMHKTDERVAVSDMHALADIYLDILKGWFRA